MGAIEKLERVIARNFSSLGDFIGRQPVRVILMTLVISCLLSLGILRFDEVNNVRTEYSPINAPSRIEYAVAKEFLGQVGGPLQMLINRI
ncbi:unnamed protein product [Gongylonema pulchrum]|uniref:Efflux RND transporter permease subunit n=1 Tax=Gongylonema pulchrum TaxID=637853 RepID=A0A183D276_9BILA|nr:unnamed protein product [Gongylonema pulchrum]